MIVLPIVVKGKTEHLANQSPNNLQKINGWDIMI